MRRHITGRRHSGAIVVALMALTMLLGTSPAAAVEAQGVRVEVAEPDLLNAASSLHPAIPPGGSATYALRVRNQHNQQVEVLVYGADVTGTHEVTSGADNRGVGGWITTDRPRLVVPAATTEDVAVSITRPAGDEEGGRGAIVVQLSDASRQELSLERIERAALPVEVAGDGGGDGVLAAVASTDLRPGLVPGVLDVTVRFTAPDEAQDEAAVDGTVVLSRPVAADADHAVVVPTVPPGVQHTATVAIDLPWYGTVADVRVEATVPGLTIRSAPVRVVVVPPWLALLLVVAAAIAVQRAHRKAVATAPRDELATAPRDAGAG